MKKDILKICDKKRINEAKGENPPPSLGTCVSLLVDASSFLRARYWGRYAGIGDIANAVADIVLMRDMSGDDNKY